MKFIPDVYTDILPIREQRERKKIKEMQTKNDMYLVFVVNCSILKSD